VVSRRSIWFKIALQRDVALKRWIKNDISFARRSSAHFASCSAVALMTAALREANAEVKLDASYTISFARIRVGNITATVVTGDREYAISARGHAGGVMKLLVDGEASFNTRGTIKHGHPVPTTFTSKIVSDAQTLDVTMVLDEGSAAICCDIDRRMRSNAILACSDTGATHQYFQPALPFSARSPSQMIPDAVLPDFVDASMQEIRLGSNIACSCRGYRCGRLY
jgi:hypothetical protein